MFPVRKLQSLAKRWVYSYVVVSHIKSIDNSISKMITFVLLLPS